MQKSTEWLTSSWSYCLFIALLAMVIMALVMFIPAGDSNITADSSMRFGHIGAAFSSLPTWVTRWMTFQHYVFAGSLLFFIWHVEARVYLFGLIVSHGIFMIQVSHAPFNRLELGLVSLNHLTWIPALLFMIYRWPALNKNSPYSLWYHIAIFQLLFSLTFDIRDSTAYIATLLLR